MSPRSKKQLEDVRRRSRENIKLAALKLFAHNGYHNTSVQEIAKKAGVSKGLAYNYFKGKEKILEAVIFETFHEMAMAYGFHYYLAKVGLSIEALSGMEVDMAGVAFDDMRLRSTFIFTEWAGSVVAIFVVVLASALYPAWRASRLEPAEAMRSYE